MQARSKGAGGKPILEIAELTVAYGKAEVVHGVTMEVHPGEFVVLLGRNGAGKTTILQSVAALLPRRGGRIAFDGQDISNWSARRIAGAGLHSVLERHRVFTTLSVEDNLLLGTAAAARRWDRRLLDDIYDRFPELAAIRGLPAAKLSGGQQEILAVAQGIIVRPKLLLLDEPSSGLAPLMIDRILKVAAELAQAGTAVLLVEQLVEKSLRYADYCYLVDTGRIAGSGAPADIAGSTLLEDVYLGKSGHA